MELTPNELEIIRMALARCHHELDHQIDGTRGYTQVIASGWYACRHVREKIATLIVRVEKELGV
jgi:hypothetical protein